MVEQVMESSAAKHRPLLTDKTRTKHMPRIWTIKVAKHYEILSIGLEKHDPSIISQAFTEDYNRK